MKLHDYQWELVDKVVENKRVNLFVPMGLGKTVTVLTALDILSLTDDCFPALVLGPLRVVASTWPDEVAKWDHLKHLKVSVVTGTKAEREAALRREADIYCMNYDNLQWLDTALREKPWPFKTVVADECSKLKGYRTRQGSVRAAVLGKYVHDDVTRYIGLTGTPASNGVQDIWAITWFVDRGQRLGRTFSSFSQRWFAPDWSGYGLVPHKHSQGEIQELIKDISLSLNAADHFDLTEPIRNNIYVDLPNGARDQYRQMETQMFTELAGEEVEAFSAAAKTMKLLQFANGAVYTDESGGYGEAHDGKIEALRSVVEEANGAPVLVAYHFKSDLERLLKAFPKARALDKSTKTIRDWNAGKIPVLLAHPASAGHGLNLAAGGSILAFFSVNWNLEEHLQIIERIGPTRQAQLGSGRAVYLHYILARNTVDELVMQRLDGKKSVQQILMDAMKRRAK
ncbi:MAG: hypothetical protein CGW95_06515 [Phenylobacterium zucineum]|nr:MAG: hypothetical protein CGW95_06515 [Phenylobacterium zucineum]